MSDETAKVVREILWYTLYDNEEAIEYMIEILQDHYLESHRG